MAEGARLELVRRALLSLLQHRSQVSQASSGDLVSAATSSGYTFPSSLQDILPALRAFGGQIPAERRRRFQTLLAAAEVAREVSQNPQDARLCKELLVLEKRFGLM